MAASPNSASGAFRHQDGQVIARMLDHGEPHVQQRWNQRCPDGWEDYSVRVAWREAEPIGTAGGGSFRLHEETGLVLVSQYAFLQTVYRPETDAERDL